MTASVSPEVIERDCKHGQLARSCNLCDAARDIEAAFYEGYARGFDNANYNEPKFGLAQEEYEGSEAKSNAESI